MLLLQAIGSGGNDDVIRHGLKAMNAVGTWVFRFQKPSKLQAAYDDFEKMLHQNGTRILKFYLHISRRRSSRFKQRLDDPSRHWKDRESDYSERQLWPDYIGTFAEAMEKGQHETRALVRNPVRP